MRAGYAFLLVFDHCILALVPNGHFVQPHDVTLLAFHESPQLRTRTSKSILSFPTPLTNRGNPLFPLDLLGTLSLDDREHAHMVDTHQMKTLLAEANKAGAKVVL